VKLEIKAEGDDDFSVDDPLGNQPVSSGDAMFCGEATR
jgi:hypothetical protein